MNINRSTREIFVMTPYCVTCFVVSVNAQSSCFVEVDVSKKDVEMFLIPHST